MDNLESGSRNPNDLYNTSLTEQYRVLCQRFDGNFPETLVNFIDMFCPACTSEYFISLPSFDRKISTVVNRSGRENNYINNMVIRPTGTVYCRGVLPDNYELILIGDVMLGSVVFVSVKGIDIIDKSMKKFGEKSVKCNAACAFSRTTLRTGASVPDYGTRELHESVLTNDFVDELFQDLSPVPKTTYKKVLKIFEDWQKYIEFRKYYLTKQSEKCEAISFADVSDAYMISREAYRRREEDYAPLLLDGVSAFARSEQVILSKAVTGAESFPLIRIDIDKNRKQVLSETTGKFGKGKPKYEADLQRYTKNAMGLSPSEPKFDDNGNLPKGYKFNQYLLGERYLFTFADIEPDCEAIESKYERNRKAAEKAIDDKYVAVISAELTKFMAAQEPTITAKYTRQLSDYERGLNNTIDDEVRENHDRDIKKEFERAVAEKVRPLKITYDRNRQEIEQRIIKLKKDGEQDKAAQLQESIIALKRKYEEGRADAAKELNLRDFYVARNNKLIANKRKSLDIAKQTELDKVRRERERQLQTQYEGTIRAEKAAAQKELAQKRNQEKDIKIENETIRRYSVYFRPDDGNKTIAWLKKEIAAIDARYLTYDSRAERTKIERQERALVAFMGGYVKNPYLPAYLFDAKSLGSTKRTADDIDWCLESLNDRQKIAVQKALASESIFLLQGPPGTGKTQVIAEITAQLCKRGKKVLISSETHKAIDNVFERLPKIPEIRPLRLIPSQNGKETNYSPERLVDNFYLNISHSLEKQVYRFEHFEETKATFGELMKKLRFDYDKVLRLEGQVAQVQKERREVSANINKLNSSLDNLRGESTVVREEIEQFRRTIKYIETYRFVGEDVKEQYLKDFSDAIDVLLKRYSCFSELSKEKVGELVKLDVSLVKKELADLLSEDTVVKLENRRIQLRRELNELMGDDFVQPSEGDANYSEFKRKQAELMELGKQIKAAQEDSKFDISDTVVFSVLPHIAGDKDKLKKLPDELTAFKIEVQRTVSEAKDRIENDMKSVLVQQDRLDSNIREKQININKLKQKLEELGEDQTLVEYMELNSALRQSVSRFMHDFDIVCEYDPNDMGKAFSIIADEWKKLERDFKSTQQENAVKIPMYRGICKYLAQEDILDEDRQEYTRALYDKVNVFGITCTSRDKFTRQQLEELGRYGIEDINIRTQGIDVVIIDEVSKSSFLDLLIPILYGKTVILVGDHRQLPPMYDLRHMRSEDFEGLNDDIINQGINEKYTALYEECFFKKLYEEVPDDFKVMLNKQYRCHSHIMEVFNHFYGGSQKGLQVGFPQQDNEKQHNLTVRINGNTVIDSEHHIYFIDCDERESSAYEGSTSKVNEQEAQVAIELLRQLDAASGELIKVGKIKWDKARRIDERPSVGIICTYGDQASLIKKKRKNKQFGNFSGKQDEKLVISTVDDFQGDERDIIILSMVRNPAPGKKFDLEFLKKFERINVALSRARKLLIVVGARKFLSDYGIIDLPDMDGKGAGKINFHVYKEIISTIDFKGKIIPARDIIPIRDTIGGK
ncbi:MAG: AAA family ATPase [Clostridiales bacterium]|nr:AAA family ATPase [Clostridiales bacterium]